MASVVIRVLKSVNVGNCKLKDVFATCRVCIHCSSQYRQNEENDGVGNLVGQQLHPKYVPREEVISRAMRSYLLKKQQDDTFMKKSLEEYELGKRHLANIMGIDEEDLTKEEIKKAIEYLLPSALHNKKARPMMEHPFDLMPSIRDSGFDYSGRPNHFLYYTVKPHYFEIMHDLAWTYEKLKKLVKSPDKNALKTEELQFLGSEWVSLKNFQKMFEGEKVTEHDYKRFVTLMERIMEHPLACMEKDLIFKYREQIKSTSMSSSEVVLEPKLDAEGRPVTNAIGARKKCVAEVTLRGNGTGKVSINNKDITFFPQVLHRQQVLWPLQLCNMIDQFDIEARVTNSGPSAQAGAIRLAIARALLHFIPTELRERLRIAGLLTRDPRMRERKKPGQEKSRKKFTWKRR